MLVFSNSHGDAEPGPTFTGRDALTWLFLFRLLLVTLLILLFSLAPSSPWAIGGPAAALPRLLLSVQALLILVGGMLVILHWPSREQQVQLAVFVDIGCYTLLMHLAGGNGTGLGVLPGIAVALGALLLEGRLSLLFASLATLAVLTEQVFSELYLEGQGGTLVQAGLLGLSYFSIAFIAFVLARRLRETESLAARRKVDIADLSKLNEYVIQTMGTGVLVVDGERRLLLLNNAARRLLGTPDAQPGDDLFALVPTLRDWFQAELETGGRGGELLHLSGNAVRASLVLLGNRRANGALIYLRDHRELVRQAQEIKLASLGRLTASIAHNIRNPLSAVNHAGQLLAESTALADEDRHLLGIIRRNVLRIDETVNSVLELSRRQQAAPELIDLGAWLQDFCSEYRDNHQLPARALRLRLPAAAIKVQVDPRHLHQVVHNLCDNAVKHGVGDDGAVRVALTLARAGAGGEPTLTVRDHGPGVPTEHLRTIFEPFFTTARGGTGLGLYAARELAEANGMLLEYSDADGGGGAFRLTFAG